MVPHHQGAIAMAELALRKARRPEIRALAQRIISSQSQEIGQMRQWYQLELLDLEQAMVRVQSSEINQMEAWARQWFGAP